MKRGDGRLLPTMLAGGTAKNAGDLSHQGGTHPQRTGLIEEIAHLRRHISEPRRRAEYYGVVLIEFVGSRQQCWLIELEPGCLGNLGRHGFRHTLDDGLRLRHASRAFSLRLCHLFDMSVAAVIENQNVRHVGSPLGWFDRVPLEKLSYDRVVVHWVI